MSKHRTFRFFAVLTVLLLICCAGAATAESAEPFRLPLMQLHHVGLGSANCHLLIAGDTVILIDGGTDTGSQTHTKTLNKYLIDLGIAEHDASSTAEDAIDPSVEDFRTLKLWIQSTDGAGNVKAFSFPLTVDPQGDKPSVSISQPHVSAGTIPTLGGSIMITGFPCLRAIS